MRFKATIAGIKVSQTQIKYDTIEITKTQILLKKGDSVLATMPTSEINTSRGDILTISGINGKLIIDTDGSC